jgi:hypothetical protein
VKNMLDGWKGVAIIVAGLALLGFLVFMKVDGAAVAAIAGVTTVLAYLTRSPHDSATPPPGAKLVPFAAVGLAALSGWLSACASKDPVCDPSAYSAELASCTATSRTLAESVACENGWRARCGRPHRALLADAGDGGGDQ